MEAQTLDTTSSVYPYLRAALLPQGGSGTTLQELVSDTSITMPSGFNWNPNESITNPEVNAVYNNNMRGIALSPTVNLTQDDVLLVADVFNPGGDNGINAGGYIELGNVDSDQLYLSSWSSLNHFRGNIRLGGTGSPAFAFQTTTGRSVLGLYYNGSTRNGQFYKDGLVASELITSTSPTGVGDRVAIGPGGHRDKVYMVAAYVKTNARFTAAEIQEILGNPYGIFQTTEEQLPATVTTTNVIIAGGGDYTRLQDAIEARKNQGILTLQDIVLTGTETTATASEIDLNNSRLRIRGATEWTDPTGIPANGVTAKIDIGESLANAGNVAGSVPIYLKDLFVTPSDDTCFAGRYWGGGTHLDMERMYLNPNGNNEIISVNTNSSSAYIKLNIKDIRCEAGREFLVSGNGQTEIYITNSYLDTGQDLALSYNNAISMPNSSIKRLFIKDTVINHRPAHTGNKFPIVVTSSLSGSALTMDNVVINRSSTETTKTTGTIDVSIGNVYYNTDFTSATNAGGDWTQTFYDNNLDSKGFAGGNITEWNLAGGAPPPGDKTVNLNIIGPGSTVYQPTVIQDKLINLNRIESTAQNFDPTVIKPKSVELVRIESTAQLFNPSVSKGVDVDLNFIASTAQVFNPTVLKDKIINLDFINSTTQVFDPTVQKNQTIELTRIESTTQVFEPSVLRDKTIDLEFIDSNTSVYLPLVSGGAPDTPSASISPRIQIQWDSLDRL